MNLTIGADPEFFVRKQAHYIPGHIFQCGNKTHPMRTEHGFVQVDGIALEANVKPASTRDEFVSSVLGVVGDLRSIVHRVNPGATLEAQPSIFFGHRRLSRLPIEFAELGCNADYNGWTLHKNPPPDAGSPIRTGAGHIHIGWTKDENPRDFKYIEKCSQIVRQLDYYLGLPSLLWDNDNRRRQLYGRAGAFRPKPYGLEYRVLSNAWLRSEKMIGWIFDRTVAAVTAAWANNNLSDEYGQQAVEWINENITNWHEKVPELAERVLV